MLSRSDLLDEMNALFARRNRTVQLAEETDLREIGFRSLDFSEMAIRVERKIGRDLNFDAALLRKIETVADVLSFFERAQG